MQTTDIITLASQLFVGDRPDPEKIEPVTSRQDHTKPGGGMWTSTHDGSGGSDWTDWCKTEMPHWLKQQRWVLQPAPCRVGFIADPTDLDAFIAEYGVPCHEYPAEIRHIFRERLDWPRVAADWDAIHFPTPWPWRLGQRGLFFYTLDVESTIWFRWCFDGVAEEVTP